MPDPSGLHGKLLRPTEGPTSFSTQTAVNTLNSHDGPSGTVRLVVLGSGMPVTYPLPTEGEIVLGRGEQANIVIEDESISRRHARFLIGDRLMIEDLGSLNGTRVRERALREGERAEVVPGEAFELGKVMCIVQRRSPTSERPRLRLRPHTYVDARIDEELDRGTAVAFARFHVERAAGGAPLSTEVLEDISREVLGPNDLAAEYAPGELEVLFLGVDAAVVEKRCKEILEGLRKHGPKVVLGVAHSPADGRSAAALLDVANARALGSSADASSSPVRGSAMELLHRLVDRVAKSDISIVLHGETGVGKEVIARELHRSSLRATKPFMGLNCAALSETLLESELFGHERGAFSGAVAMKPGLFEVANEGTVFLDEIAEMTLPIQAKLLRVLEERQVLRVGGLQPRAINVRFLAASHRDLESEVEQGRFRQDLYFRLNGITLDIPPLRQRVEEIEGLAKKFLTEACRREKREEIPVLSKEAMSLFKQYAWPGNIRELRNVIERAALLCTGSTITFEHLPVDKMLAQRAHDLQAAARANAAAGAFGEQTPAAALHMGPFGHPTSSMSGPTSRDRLRRPVLQDADTASAHRDNRSNSDGRTQPPPSVGAPAPQGTLKDQMEELERHRILEVLQQCGGNQTKAAALLGISRRTLLHRLDEYGLPRPRKP